MRIKEDKVGNIFTSVPESCYAIKYVMFINILYMLDIKLPAEDQRMMTHCPYPSGA